MARAFRETHEARMAADPEYAVAYIHELKAALRNARVGLKMWSMSTEEIDVLIGPMNEEDSVRTSAGRGGSLWDGGDGVAASGQISSKE